jgi:hypothetical protein
VRRGDGGGTSYLHMFRKIACFCARRVT